MSDARGLLRHLAGGNLPANLAIVGMLAWPLVLVGCAVPPHPPTTAEFQFVVRNFDTIRPSLDSLVLTVRELRRRGFTDSQVESTLAVPDTSSDRQPQPPYGLPRFRAFGKVIAISDSLIYVPVIVRRGTGPSAGWAICGYVSSHTYPASFPEGGPGAQAYKGKYERLAGEWYAFSMVWDR